MSGTKKEVVELRRSLGLCVDCGGPIETPERGYRSPPIRCAACRKILAEIKAEYKARQKQREERAKLADYTPPRDTCKACVLSSYAGAGVWFCPLPVCARVEKKLQKLTLEETAGSEITNSEDMTPVEDNTEAE